MPTTLLYLFLMLAIILAWFAWFKRPIYEAVFVSFAVLMTITGHWADLGTYVNKALSTSLLYSMISFVSLSIILTKTHVIDSCIALIISILGHVRGGAGYAAIISSAFLGALSGSGPGNVMASGSFTIPAMKRSGFPPELAANIESNASYMGNMIPPSSNILAAMGAYIALYPESHITNSHFWAVMWGLSLWFILQRIVMVWAFCKYYKVAPMAKEDIPNFWETVKSGWQAFILPAIILFPFLLDYLYKDSFFTERLGANGAKYFSSSILLFIGGVASIYACLICKNKEVRHPQYIAKLFSDSIKSISPSIGVCVFGYMIGALFNDLKLADELGLVIASWNFNMLGTVLAVCIITCIMGMVIPGSSLVVIFGPMFITTLANSGVNPLIAAAMLPCICGVMCGITPPLGLGMYAGMTLAESDFQKTYNNNLWWVAAQFILEVIVLMGFLPVLGL